MILDMAWCILCMCVLVLVGLMAMLIGVEVINGSLWLIREAVSA